MCSAKKMLTIHKDSFDMIEQDVASGTLEKSKILNCLFWKSNDTCDPAKVLNQSDNQPSRPSSNPNVTDSMLDKLDKHALWDALSAPNLEDDGCEYCTMQPVERQRFPKHFMYTNGKLTCPLLLSQRTTNRLDTWNTRSNQSVGKKRFVKRPQKKGLADVRTTFESS